MKKIYQHYLCDKVYIFDPMFLKLAQIICILYLRIFHVCVCVCVGGGGGGGGF